MLPTYQPARRKEHSNLKRTIKFMAQCKDPTVQRMLLQSANDSVYKAICNAFLNVAQNSDIKLPPAQQRKLKRFNPLIQKIISSSVHLKRKRRLIQRGGGLFLAAILPAVLTTALSFLGSAFFNKHERPND